MKGFPGFLATLPGWRRDADRASSPIVVPLCCQFAVLHRAVYHNRASAPRWPERESAVRDL